MVASSVYRWLVPLAVHHLWSSINGITSGSWQSLSKEMSQATVMWEIYMALWLIIICQKRKSFSANFYSKKYQLELTLLSASDTSSLYSRHHWFTQIISHAHILHYHALNMNTGTQGLQRNWERKFLDYSMTFNQFPWPQNWQLLQAL